jgi:predicted metal-dependent enzyme (double-stranded beta helix superfamily)
LAIRNKHVKQLINELSRMDWTTQQWRKEAEYVISSADGLSNEITTHMSEWDASERSAKLNGSHETSTHYKILLHRDPALRFTVWIHCYKSSECRGSGYAQVPHNHRYDLCSVVLRGGYDSILYSTAAGVTPIERRTFKPGDVLSMTHDQVHALTEICEGTQTLFIEGPTIKHFSTVFPVDSPPRDYPDFHGLWDGVMLGLKAGI